MSILHNNVIHIDPKLVNKLVDILSSNGNKYAKHCYGQGTTYGLVYSTKYQKHIARILLWFCHSMAPLNE